MRLHQMHECTPAFSACLAGNVGCPKCREQMVAPELTEFVDSREIRHHWLCDACGAQFCTALSMPEAAAE